MDSMTRCCEDATNRTRAGVMPRFAPRSSNAQNEATKCPRMSGNVRFARSMQNAQNEPTAAGHFRTSIGPAARNGTLWLAQAGEFAERTQTRENEANRSQR